MAEQAAGEPKGFFARLRAAPRRLSTAAKVSLALAAFLVLAVAVVWTVFLVDPSHVPWRHSISAGRVLAVILLVLIIPPLTYWCLRLWLEGETSRFPDLDYAWNAGLAELRRNGISLDAAPLFLILGSAGDEFERVITQASGLGFRVRGTPEGPAPLHWYANSDGIYLFCSEAGWLSALCALAEKHSRREMLREPAPAMPSFTETFTSPTPAAAPPTTPAPAAPQSPMAGGGSGAIGGTILLDQFVTGSNAPVAEASPRPSGPAPRTGPARYAGTLTFNEPVPSEPAPTPAPMNPQLDPRDAVAPADNRFPTLDAHAAGESLQRLDHVGQFLRRTRHPLCPVNGVLMMLPFPLVERGLSEANELTKAVKSDLAALERSLQLRCPVTALVTGMEKESGFRELVRRVGRDRAAAQRFGRRFDVRALPTPEQMAALCIHVCGVFEDWIYTLFREEGALTKPGNTRLYGLLCKVRCNLKGPLMEILAGGFGHDSQTSKEEPVAFSGCYFAATGPTTDRQAFVRGVFDKLTEEQEDVEWTRGALAAARTTRMFTWVAAGLAILLTILLLVLLASALELL